MGARESRAAQDGDDNAPPDYYQLLEVEETASQDEIRVPQTLMTKNPRLIGVFSVHFADSLLYTIRIRTMKT